MNPATNATRAGGLENPSSDAASNHLSAETRYVLDRDGDVWRDKNDGSGWWCLDLEQSSYSFHTLEALTAKFGPLVELVPATDRSEESLLAIRGDLLRLLVPVVHTNGYPVRAVPQVAILDYFASAVSPSLLAGSVHPSSARGVLVDVIAAALCAQEEANPDDDWRGQGTDDVAALLADALVASSVVGS